MSGQKCKMTQGPTASLLPQSEDADDITGWWGQGASSYSPGPNPDGLMVRRFAIGVMRRGVNASPQPCF